MGKTEKSVTLERHKTGEKGSHDVTIAEKTTSKDISAPIDIQDPPLKKNRQGWWCVDSTIGNWLIVLQREGRLHGRRNC